MMSEDKEKTMKLVSLDLAKILFYLVAVICAVTGTIPWWFVGFMFLHDFKLEIRVGND